MKNPSKKSPKKKPVGMLDEVDMIELRYLQLLRRRMAERRLTIQSVARMAGMNPAVASATLAGCYALTFKAAHRLSKAVGIDFDPKIRKAKESKGCPGKQKARRKKNPSAGSANSTASKCDSSPTSGGE